ncbi:hypothetical protein [Pengzhenrongella sp.]|uniref:hypothetical protein n=1 Tax=Pengzhenrongella sp. TaxID=2888820 RepID=UPI002F92DD01
MTAVGVGGLLGGCSAAQSTPSVASTGVTGAAVATVPTGVTVPAGFTATTLVSGHGATTGPDDITQLGDRIYVGYQNGVGSKGEPAPGGGRTSTVVAYTTGGTETGRWTLTGKVDGMTADPTTHTVLATVNEDANSSLYSIDPATGQGKVTHYQFSPNPLPHGGGTDSISVRNGQVFVVASAPAAKAGTKTYTAPALYTVTLAGTTASTTPALQDNARATDAVTGKSVTLNLSDPDSSESVPASDPRFGGDLLLDGQGDQQLVFVSQPGAKPKATVLNIKTQVDDSAFATGPGQTLYVVDSAKNSVIAIRGDFKAGDAFASIPKDSTKQPATLGRVNLSTGQITAFATGLGSPKGLLFASN